MNNLSLNEKYLVDKEGRRVGVVLSMQEFQSLINRLEELESFKSAREEINIVDQLISERKRETIQENVPTFKRRQGPGGMVVV
jgi:PHD/YefM family antitoxin component YafN of YafNO toxin-antitoxin module